MAKLTNVKYPNEVVEIDGVTYRKVERKARAGDIVKALNDDYPDVTYGAFYVIDSDGGFYDDVDDFRTAVLRNHPEDFEVYEKVAEQLTPQYREVERDAMVGDRIRIVNTRDRRWDNGGFCNADALHKVTKEEYEEATNPKPKFNVGDTVRLSVPAGKNAKFGWGRVNNGDIGKVVYVGSVRIDVDFPSQSYWGADPSELTLITAEEVKWAKIGRKVNEFKAGDIVQITANTNGSVNKVGSYGEVAEGLSMSGSYRVETGAGSVGNLTRPTDMRLIVPVEQRLDTKEAA